MTSTATLDAPPRLRSLPSELARSAPVSGSLALLLLAAPALGLPPLRLNAPTLGGLLLAHAVHTTWTQVALAGGATVALAVACERAWGSTRLVLFLSLAALGVGLAVLGAEAGRLSSYVGSSGIGHALAGGWLVTRGRGALGRPAAIGLLAVLAFKVSWELATGAVAVSSGLAGAVPVPAAHAAGLALGCALAPIAARAPRRGRPKALAA